MVLSRISHPTHQSSQRLTLGQHPHVAKRHVNLQQTLQADVDYQQTLMCLLDAAVARLCAAEVSAALAATRNDLVIAKHLLE